MLHQVLATTLLDGVKPLTTRSKRGTTKAAIISKAQAQLWDEVTMTHKKAIEAVDRAIRDIMSRKKIVWIIHTI